MVRRLELTLLIALPLLVLAACNRQATGNGAASSGAPTGRSPAAIRAAEAGDADDAKGLANAAAAPVAATPSVGRCHGDECSWFRIESKTLVREEASGILYRLSVLGGSAPDEENPRIRWDRAPHDVFVFCSRRLPAVILPVDGALQVDVLDFVTGRSGPYVTSANIYAATCHPGEDWASDGFAGRHGYQVQDADREVSLARPEDIFAAVR